MQSGSGNEAPASSPTSKLNLPSARLNTQRLFEVPAPIKRIFNRFPFLTYPANDLPLRAPKSRTQHALYLFQVKGSSNEEASCNPSCLKWQVSFENSAALQNGPERGSQLMYSSCDLRHISNFLTSHLLPLHPTTMPRLVARSLSSCQHHPRRVHPTSNKLPFRQASF